MLRCFKPIDLAVTAVAFVAWTALWLAGYQSLLAASTFALVPAYLYASRRAA